MKTYEIWAEGFKNGPVHATAVCLGKMQAEDFEKTMGTRNLTCVVKDGEYKIAQYCQWDGYPSGNGVEILEFLKNMDRNHFENRVNDCVFISSDEVHERWKECGADDSGFVDLEISDKFKEKYPLLHRDTHPVIKTRLKFIMVSKKMGYRKIIVLEMK